MENNANITAESQGGRRIMSGRGYPSALLGTRRCKECRKVVGEIVGDKFIPNMFAENKQWSLKGGYGCPKHNDAAKARGEA